MFSAIDGVTAVPAAETEVIASESKSYSSEDQCDGLQLLHSWQGPKPTALSLEPLPV